MREFPEPSAWETLLYTLLVFAIAFGIPTIALLR